MTYRLGSDNSLLTAAEEVELAKKIEAGRHANKRIAEGRSQPNDQQLKARGDAAKERFIQANLRLVLSIAGKARTPGHVDRQDVIQDGMLGLERAVDKFEWRKGYKFSTYATWWIRQSIQRGLENTASTIRIPAHRTSELRSALGEDNDVRGLPAKLARVAALEHLESLDRPVGDGSTTIADLSPSSDEGPQAQVETNELRAEVAEMLNRLDPMTAEALVARFGLDGAEPMTYGAIAEQLGVSPEAIRRRVLRSLDNLRPWATRLDRPDPESGDAAFAAA